MPVDAEVQSALDALQRRVATLALSVEQPIFGYRVAGGAGILQNSIAPNLNGSSIRISGNLTLNDDIADLYAFLSSFALDAGAVVYSTASAWALSAVGTANQVLVSGGTGAPVWRASLTASATAVVATGTFQATGAVTFDSTLTFSTAASRIIPGATSLSLRNNANNADNILVADAGAVTFRAGLSGITTLSLSGALTSTSTTDATSINSGSIITDGGVGIEKALWVGGLANIAGAVTAQSTLTVSGLGRFNQTGSSGAASFGGAFSALMYGGTYTAVSITAPASGYAWLGGEGQLTADTDTIFSIGARNIGSSTNKNAGQIFWRNDGSAATNVTSQLILQVSSAGTLTTMGTFTTAGFTVAGTLTTSAPTGGAGAWELGIANAVSPTSPNRTITIEIGGTAYYLHAKTTND